MGPPVSTVHTEASTETFVDTVTLTQSLSQLFGGNFGLSYGFDAAEGHFLVGVDGNYFHDISSVIGGQSIVTERVNSGDTVTDIDIEGLPSDQIVIPGEEGEDRITETPHELTEDTQGVLTGRLSLMYDQRVEDGEGLNLAIRAAAGPVVEFTNGTHSSRWSIS